jgi:hypothetical protein
MDFWIVGHNFSSPFKSLEQRTVVLDRNAPPVLSEHVPNSIRVCEECSETSLANAATRHASRKTKRNGRIEEQQEVVFCFTLLPLSFISRTSLGYSDDSSAKRPTH